MEWTECISKAISYIEDNITEELTIENIADQAMISPFYFQKGFAMLCGFTVGEYIKNADLRLPAASLYPPTGKLLILRSGTAMILRTALPRHSPVSMGLLPLL